MKIEDHFKETLNRAVGNEPPVLDAWDRFEARATRSRRVRWVAAFAAAAAVAIASVIVVPKLGTRNIEFANPTPTETPSPTPSVDPYEGWKTFTNAEQHYSLKYPADWKHTEFEAVHEFVPPGLDATDAKGPEGSFGVIVNVLRVAQTGEPSRELSTDEGRVTDVMEVRDGAIIVRTHRIDWSASRCISLETTCPDGDDLVLTVRINGEDTPELFDQYRDAAELIARSVEYIP